MKFRHGLLLGAAFAAGIAFGPAAGMLERQFGVALVPAALAQDGNRAEINRLLSLFGNVFERIRQEYVQPVDDRDLIENAIGGMVSGLDPHSVYLNEKAFRDSQVSDAGRFGGLGLELTQEGGFVRVISPIDDTPASKGGVLAGDLILAINGTSLQGLTLGDAVDKLRGAPDTKVSVTVKHEGVDKPVEIPLVREIIHTQLIKSHLVDNNIAYIRITTFGDNTEGLMRKAFEDLKQQAGGKLAGVVLDLRNNPGGLLDQGIGVAGDFINQGEIVSLRARHKEDSESWQAKNAAIVGSLPVVVLINGGTASAAEIVAGALQDQHRAILLGNRSFGKGSVQTLFPLQGNGAMRITTARYYTPSGRSIQGLGITPDVVVSSQRMTGPQFTPNREADLKGSLANTGGAPNEVKEAKTVLPAIAKDIPKIPPEGWPVFDPNKPATDFQLQQAVRLLRAMPADQAAVR